MVKPSLMNIAGCYTFLIDGEYDIDDISKYALDRRMGCIIITDYINLPFNDITACIIVYATHLRKAFEMYHDFKGQMIRNIDESFVQSILTSIGDTSGKVRNSYIISVKEIIRKE